MSDSKQLQAELAHYTPEQLDQNCFVCGIQRRKCIENIYGTQEEQ